VSVFLIDE